MPHTSLHDKSIRIKKVSFCDREIQGKCIHTQKFFLALAKFLLALAIILPVFTQTFSNLSPSLRDPAKDADWEGSSSLLTQTVPYPQIEKKVFNDSPTLGSNLRDYENPFHVLYITCVPLTPVCCTIAEQEKRNCDSSTSPFQRSK